MDAETRAKIAADIAEQHAFAVWFSAMPNVPGHHRNADVVCEAITEAQFQSWSYFDPWLQETADTRCSQEDGGCDTDPTCPEFWDAIEQALTEA